MNVYYRLFAVGIVAILVLALVNTYYINNSSNSVKLEIVLGEKPEPSPSRAYLYVSASYRIQVYRNGELIAERIKENDPITIQWYRMLANMMFGFIRSGILTWYDTSYTERSWVDTGAYKAAYEYSFPIAYIALGSGSGSPSLYDYKLFNEVTKDVAEVSVVDDSVNQQYIISYTKTFTISQDFTLTEVGLLLYLDADPSGGVSMVYLLVAHDVVDPSISLVAGDSVSVTYQVTIPYNPDGPFTKWFYYGVINYWLGYRGTVGSSFGSLKAESGNTGGIDTGIDMVGYGYSYYTRDYVDGEYLYIEVGNGSSTASPVFETYSLGNMLQRKPTTDTQCIAEVDETNSFQVHYVCSFTFLEPVSVSEVGVSYYTDRMADNQYAGDYYLWLYWVLPSPINVAENSGLRVEITIIIPYT